MARSESITTSPLAAVALQLMQTLDKLIGPIEAQMFMMQGNEMLGGDTPITAIKAKRSAELQNAIRQVAMEKGLFKEPFLPPLDRLCP
jgi:hypothetical protein